MKEQYDKVAVIACLNRIIEMAPNAPQHIRKQFSDRVERWFNVGNELGIVLRSQLTDHIDFETKLDKVGNELLEQLRGNFQLFSDENLKSCLKNLENDE